MHIEFCVGGFAFYFFSSAHALHRGFVRGALVRYVRGGWCRGHDVFGRLCWLRVAKAEKPHRVRARKAGRRTSLTLGCSCVTFGNQSVGSMETFFVKLFFSFRKKGVKKTLKIKDYKAIA